MSFTNKQLRHNEGFETFSVRTRPKVLAIHLELLQYPILGEQIRERMREELFSRGIIDVATLEHEVRDKAIKSQQRERLDDPLSQETEEVWTIRLSRIRDILTEFYFAINFTHLDFLRMVEEVLSSQGPASRPDNRLYLSINPEIAPWKMLFAQAKQISAASQEKQHALRHHLREIIVVLTKGMLSDQLSFVKIAKDNFDVEDLDSIYRRRIGRGKIGGKAGGMMLAKSILHRPEESDPCDFRQVVTIPESYFLGSDVLYEFFEANNLGDSVNLKYMAHDELSDLYPSIVKRYLSARIPEPYRERLREVLEKLGSTPVIVRSSSLLEDNFGISFAGKYDSFFCPNQGTPEQNMEQLTDAIKRVYASLASPDAVAYRQQHDLIDYDERMGILIQKVVGHQFGDHYFPVVAGVGFSFNPFQWNPRIDRNAGFLRIVAGIGTRAVDRLSSDYAQMVALSHPTLRPVKSSEEIIQYSQQQMDVINLRENRMETLPVNAVLSPKFPFLKHIAAINQGGELLPILIKGPTTVKGDIVITFPELLKNRKFVKIMRGLLDKLQRHYRKPVDIEFVVEFLPGSELDFRIHLLQCRQQSRRANEEKYAIPEEIPERDVLFVSRRMVSSGRVQGIRYVVYVDPEEYKLLNDTHIRQALGRIIGKINVALADESFILVGPGRWGSTNIDLGVQVSYGEIFNAKALVEIALPYGDAPPEASYGTHFFQDLVESNIYPLPVYPSEKGGHFNFDFFRQQENVLLQLVPTSEAIAGYLKVIDIKGISGGKLLEIVMNAHEERAIGYLTRPPRARRPARIRRGISDRELRRVTGEYRIEPADESD